MSHRLPDRVLFISGSGLLVCWSVLGTASVASGDSSFMEFFSAYLGTPFLVLCACTEMVFSWRAVQLFHYSEPLFAAWRLILTSGICHSIGVTTQHLLGAETAINVLTYSSVWSDSLARELQAVGYLISGPIRLAALAAGLSLVLSAARGLIRARLARMDYFFVCCVCLFGFYQVTQSATWLTETAEPLTLARITTGVNGLLLAVLLIQAIFLHRNMMELGRGRIALCWNAFAIAILCTTLATLGQGAMDDGHLPYSYRSIMWCVSLPAAVAYALGPIYQLQAAQVMSGWADAQTLSGDGGTSN